jgi:hypothetical protein
MNLKHFVDAAIAQGHKVFLASKELHNIPRILALQDISILQAPYLWRKPPRSSEPYICYAQIATSRFADEDELAVLCNAWENIFKIAEPELVIYDHAPSALISSLGKSWDKWIIGNAFLVPGCDQSYLGIFPGTELTEENILILRRSNQKLKSLVNSYLTNRRLPQIQNLKALFTQAQKILLLTTPEMDYYAPRTRPANIEYLGIDVPEVGTNPDWPRKGQYKIFCYIENFPAIDKLLALLNSSEYSVILYGPKIPQQLRQRFNGLYFSSEPVNIGKMLETADLFINMGNHSTCLQALLANVPQLLIPGHQEQAFNAQQIVKHKGGVIMSRETDDVEKHFNRAMQAMQKKKSYAKHTDKAQPPQEHMKKRIYDMIGEYQPNTL